MFSDSLPSLITTLFLFKHMHVYVCINVYICTMCVWIQDRVGPPGTGIKGDCEPPHMGLVNILKYRPISPSPRLSCYI